MDKRNLVVDNSNKISCATNCAFGENAVHQSNVTRHIEVYL